MKRLAALVLSLALACLARAGEVDVQARAAERLVKRSASLRKAFLKDLSEEEALAFLPAAREGFRKAPPGEKAPWESLVMDASAAAVRKMTPSGSGRPLALNVLLFMRRNIRWHGEVPGDPGREPHEWPGKRVLANGTFNGCVEAAKAFKVLYDAAGAEPCLFVGGTLKGRDGGHAVIEVPDAGSPFIVDTAMFTAITPATGSLSALEGLGLIKREQNGRFVGPDGQYEYVYLKTADEPFSGTDAQRVESGQRGLEDAVKRSGPGPSTDDIVIEALVDGDSALHIAKNGIYWTTGEAAKPGRHEGRDEPTFVNGEPWRPAWGRPAEARGADKSAPFAVKVPALDLDFELVAVSGQRGAKTLEERTPVATESADGEFVLTIPDREAGSRWYTIRLHRRAP